MRNIIKLALIAMLLSSCQKNDSFAPVRTMEIKCSNTKDIEVTAQDMIDVVIGDNKIVFHYTKQSWVFLRNNSESAIFLWLDGKTLFTLEANGGQLSLPLTIN